MKKFIIATEKDLVEIVQYIDTEIHDTVFALNGDLGAGKTALVKAWLKYKKTKDIVSSPTYAIINEYDTQTSIVYHMDLYRLNTLEEGLEIGIEEYLHSGNLCLIEWPEVILPLLPLPYIELQINVLTDGAREIILSRIE